MQRTLGVLMPLISFHTKPAAFNIFQIHIPTEIFPTHPTHTVTTWKQLSVPWPTWHQLVLSVPYVWLGTPDLLVDILHWQVQGDDFVSHQ